MWKKIQRETTIWTLAAWTLPFVALGLLVGVDIIGLEDLKGKITLGISITFFSVSVFWWWWVIQKIQDVYHYMEETRQSFLSIKDDIKEIKEDVRNPDNR